MSAIKELRVYDSDDNPYDIDERNVLWERALERKAAGDDPIQFTKAELSAAREWGWWSCFKMQEDWLKNSAIPMPDHKLLFGLADANDQTLREMLMKFGGYISWLEAQIGMMEGRRSALKQGYDTAIMVATSRRRGIKATEKSKEADALSESETLRQTKRMQIEQDTLIATAKGMLEGYQRAWETVSRVVTIRMTEHELSTGRHA